MRVIISVMIFCAVFVCRAQANDDLVLQILCDLDGMPASKGSGVIISPHGQVLTASHVMPEGANCVARVGSTDGPEFPISVTRRTTTGLDAVLAQLETDLSIGQDVLVCPLVKEQAIVSAAFHSKVKGLPARKDGIISKIQMTDGAVEITAPVIPAESGGPVFLRGTTKLVGLVKGADFDALGLPVRKMVPAEHLTDLGLSPARDCQPDDADKRPENQPFKVSEVTLRMDIGATNLAPKIAQVFTAMVAANAFNAECDGWRNSTDTIVNFYFSLPVRNSDCLKARENSILSLGLPEFQVLVMPHPDGDEDAAMRIRATDRLPLNQDSDLRLIYYRDANVLSLELDDIPVRFRTTNITALADLAGKEMFFEMQQFGFLRELTDLRVRINELDIDFENGSDIQIYPDDPRPEYGGAWWIAEHKFPQNRSDMASYLGIPKIAPSDSDE